MDDLPTWAGLLIIVASAPFVTASALIVHEVGHAICAEIVGIPIRRIEIGRGRTLASFRVGAAWVVIGSPRPFSGIVIPYTVDGASRTARLFYLLGGVLANALSAGLLYGVFLRVDDDLVSAILVMALIIEVFFLANLWPARRKSRGGGVSLSDGLRILGVLREDRAAAQVRRETWIAALAVYAAPGEPRPRWSAGLARATFFLREERKTDPKERRRQMDDWKRERARSHTRCERLFLADALVTKMVYEGADGDHAELDAWSAEAAALRPDLKTLRGARAAALATLGRFAEAKAELAYADYSNDFNRFLNNTFLARAEFGLGEHAAAQRALEACFEIARKHPAVREPRYWRMVETVADALGVDCPPPAEPTVAVS